MGEAFPRPQEAYGQRLMISILEERASSTPNKPFMSIPAGPRVVDGQRDISYADMANAINRCAWWMVDTLGKGEDFPPIATYMSPMDMRHPILTFASMKAGYKMFYSSPRNRPDIQVALLEKLNCTILFTPQDESETTQAVLQRRPMAKYLLPELSYFLDPAPVPPYPYTKTFAEARKDPYVVLHSSGSTGTPKILILKQGSAAAHDAFQLLPSLGEPPWFISSWTAKRVVTNFPWVHAGGAHILSSGIYNDFVPVIPAEWPLRGADADFLHRTANVQAAWYSPSVLVDLARNPTHLANLALLTNVSYSGGILPADAGDAIAQRTAVFGSMASTETGILPGEIPPRSSSDMWQYYRYSAHLGHEFRHYADELYELVLVKSKNSAKERFQGVFCTFLDRDVYEMRDLYIEHPEQKGWWRSSGRIDDVVIMADAKKLNTIPYEAVIEQHPGIATALICGTGKPRPAVLVQPVEWPGNEEEERELIEEAWPFFERANHAGPVFGRLVRELVVLVKRDRPMARAGGKDTVMRKKSLQMYEAEIEEAYRRAEELGLLYGEVAETGKLV